MLKALKKLFCKQEGKPAVGMPRTFEVTGEYPCCTDPDIPFDSLNPLQSCFRDNYRKDRHCVVESGTGTGKTALAYIASRYYLDEGQRVILTAPTKELVKSLYREASGIWGAKVVGLNTGNDRNVMDRFFIVSTPEGLISAVRTNKEWTKAGLLIIDEAHNILDPSRGGELDVAITVHSLNGGRVLLMSGTFPNKKELAVLLGADLFISNYRRTIVHVTELHTPDDMEAGPAPKKLPPGILPTLLGHVYKRGSLRLRMLKEVIEKHRDESILIFVPTKVVGFCLGESLVAPFHCADVEEKEKDRLVAEFRAGTIKTLLATNTLSQGVNTPADVVIVCGTRRGSYYLDGPEVAQMIGRAGRGKDEAQAYILGDKIEIFNAKKTLLARSLPLPVESMVLTSLSLRCATKEDLAKALNKTYAASMTTYEKVMDSVERYLRFLKACNILHEKDSGVFSLTKEGSLLARYYISPGSYIGFMRAARRLETSDFSEMERGCLLLSSILPIAVFPEYPARLEKDFHMKLLPLELDKDFSSQKAAVIKFYLTRASAIPPYLPYQLRDVQRWIGLFNDLEKYGVHERTPGKGWLLTVVIALKTNAAKAASKKKPIQPSLV